MFVCLNLQDTQPLTQGFELDGSFRDGGFSELMKQLPGRYSLRFACHKAYWRVRYASTHF
jgi:hypothetical protein